MNDDPIKIVDIIKYRNQYNTQTLVVLSRDPVFVYEKKGHYLIAEDSGFFDFLGYEPASEYSKAFGGVEFTIPLVDGSEIKASGQWWDSTPPDYGELIKEGLIVQAGIKTIEGLARCNVFTSGKVDSEILREWLENNEPSNNYDKYRVGHKHYMVHKIVSRWAPGATV